MSSRIRHISIDFPEEVELTDKEQQRLVEIVGAICTRYEAGHPGRVMWPFGIGQRMLTNPFMVGDDEPLQFDEHVFHVDVSERADWKWPCAKCGLAQGDHKGHILNPAAGDCDFAPRPRAGKPNLSVVGDKQEPERDD